MPRTTTQAPRQWVRAALVAALLATGASATAAAAPAPPGEGAAMDATAWQRIATTLVARHGEAQRGRIERGLGQLATRWRAEDGDEATAAAFCAAQFLSDPEQLRETQARLEEALQQLDGHATEAARELARFSALDLPSQPLDRLLASFTPAAHVDEDLFASKVAFVVLLNWPQTTLAQRTAEGATWSRAQWAAARLVDRFAFRLPAAVQQQLDRAAAAAERYIDAYDLPMGRLVAPDGSTPFPPELRLISHWGLRDEIRAQYSQPAGLARQQLIAGVMERIIRQEILAELLRPGDSQWDVGANRVRQPGGPWREAPPEADLRYAQLLDYAGAMRLADPYYPTLPTHIARSFGLGRELPEERVVGLLQSVLLAPEARQVGALVARRLGRPLQPFDLWYPGLRPKPVVDEAALDAITRRRWPDVAAFQRELPNLLVQLGFTPERAAWYAARIVVDPSRGPGHAYGARLREGKAHLRTRFGPQGMDFKGFNIAVHELGHNVEQVTSTTLIDHSALAGVPNNAFSEAFAFYFQARDLALLGQAVDDPQSESLATLARFWDLYEIAGTALLDLAIWHWLYEHPTATPAALREATVALARDVWNRYYAPVFGVRDQILPAIYSHIICFGLYTPDYPLGMVITFQLEQYLRSRTLGPELERMARLGRLTPDVWMSQAVGSPVSTAPLLAATRQALSTLNGDHHHELPR